MLSTDEHSNVKYGNEKHKINFKKYAPGKVYSFQWLVEMVSCGQKLPKENYIVAEIDALVMKSAAEKHFSGSTCRISHYQKKY